MTNREKKKHTRVCARGMPQAERWTRVCRGIAIALLLLWTVFIVGIEAATKNAVKKTPELSVKILKFEGESYHITKRLKKVDIKVGQIVTGGWLRTLGGKIVVQIKDGTTAIIEGKNGKMKLIGTHSAVNLEIFAETIATFKVRKLNRRESFTVKTPVAVVGVRGTFFEVAVDESGDTDVSVLEGLVGMSPADDSIEIAPVMIPQNQKTSASQNQIPAAPVQMAPEKIESLQEAQAESKQADTSTATEPSESEGTEPVKPEPAQAEPVKSEPAQAESEKAEPEAAETGSTEEPAESAVGFSQESAPEESETFQEEILNQSDSLIEDAVEEVSEEIEEVQSVRPTAPDVPTNQ